MTNKQPVIISALCFTIIFIACKQTPKTVSAGVPANAREVKLQLGDSLGTATFFVPLRYDTAFTWVNYSDCGKSCNKIEYRYQPKILRITEESGWFWLGEPKDSIERFTISHSAFFPFHNINAEISISNLNEVRYQITHSYFYPAIIFDTTEKIGERFFKIYVMQDSAVVQTKKVLAVTTIKSNIIKFQFDLMTGKKDSISNNFIKNAVELIRTIRLSNGI